jgi:hypothetical protein
VVPNSRKDFALVPGVVSFRMGPDERLYMVGHGGTVMRVSPRVRPPSCASPTTVDAAAAIEQNDAGAPPPALDAGLGGPADASAAGRDAAGGGRDAGGGLPSTGGGGGCHTAALSGGTTATTLLLLAFAALWGRWRRRS